MAKLNGHQLELGAGFDTRIIKEDKVGASINATSFKFNTNNDNNVNGKYVRIGVEQGNIPVFIKQSFSRRGGAWSAAGMH